MEYFNEFLLVALAHMVALLSPGADFIFLASSAINHKPKTALGASVGIALSNGFYIVLALFGYATFISSSQFLMGAIRLIGGVYLIYLGFVVAKQKKTNVHVKKDCANSTFTKELTKGFLLSILNPKISLFYLSLFTLVISPKTPFYIQAYYGVYMVLIVLVWDSFLVYVINKNGQKVLNYLNINKFFGLLLFVMGSVLLYEFIFNSYM